MNPANMTKQPWYTLVLKFLIGTLVVFLGYLGMNYLIEMKEEPPKRAIPERIKTVEVTEVSNRNLSAKLDVQGRLQAYKKIDLYAEVGGAVQETGRPFKEGTYFREGQVLLRIDNNEARYSLQSQKAALMNSIADMMPDLKIDYPNSFRGWNDYLLAFDVDRAIAALPEATDQSEKLFVAGRNLYSQYYTIKSVEDRLSKYTLLAPFSGVLTTTAIDEGAIVRPGQQLGTLMATGYYELIATVPLSELNYLKPGGKVRLYSEDVDGEWVGTVRRISDQIDPSSQTVDVFVGVSGRDLREGMYLRGEADARTIENVVELDRDHLVDERDVFVVEADTLLRRVPIVVRKSNRETVIVSGLPDGAKVLSSNVAGAYDGMRVRIDGQEPEGPPATATTPAEVDPSVSK